jgi:hypothetical protein
MACADAGDAAPAEIRPMPRHTPPHIDATIRERPFVGIELRPHHRMDAIAGDQYVAMLRRERGAVRGDETGGDARVALFYPDTSVAGDEIFRPEPLAHRGEQHLVQVAAMDGKMRPLVSGRASPRLAIDQLAVARKEGIVLGLAGDRRERALEPQIAQLLDRMRPEINADPEREDFRRGLEHADAARRLGGVDGQRQRQPANAAADDDELHGPLLVYSRRYRTCGGAPEPRK